MRLPVWLLRSGRALAALLLLTTLVVGEVADARHHLSETGCASDHARGPGRDDCCACTSLHVAPLTSPSPVLMAPVVVEARAIVCSREHTLVVRSCGPDAPRGPPVA